jgi:Bacterial Ig domain
MFHLVIRRFSKLREPCRRVRGAALAAAAASVGLAIIAGPAAAATYQAPSSIANDCSVDVTPALLSWIGSVPDYSTLSFATNGCYRIEGTLEFSGRKGLDFEGNGSTFRSFNAPTDTRAIWRAWQSTGLIFRNMAITGSYANGGTFDSSLQHAHGIDLRGTGAEVANVTVDNVAGDCVYFGLGSDNTTRSSGSFHNSTCTGTSRNAVSLTAGNNVLVQFVTVGSIGYDVFDVEPNTGTSNWGAQNVIFDGNTIGSYALSIFSIVPNAPLSSLYFTNNVVASAGLKITTGSTTTAANRPQGVTITGNSSKTPEPPAAMDLSSIDGLTVVGNVVPMTAGTMASVETSCNVNVSSNSYPGGTSEYSIIPYTCLVSSPLTSTAPPTVTITSPSSGTLLSGARTAIAASASYTAVKMAVYIDGTLQSTSSTSSINTMWNLKKVASGSHTITVDAWDSSNNMGSSTVTVRK